MSRPKKLEIKSMDKIQNSLKHILCELLKDAEIQENIAKIVREDRKQEEEFQQKIEALEKEKKVLYHQLEEAQIECKRLYENCKNLEKENREIQSSKDDIYKKFQNQKKEFESLEEIKEIWKGILKLEKSQKSYLIKLCGSWDIKSFIALGKDKNGIKQLWNFIRDEIMNSNRNMENIRILAEFFDLCINVYNITNIRKEYYEKIEVFIGKEYNSRQYIKTSESVVNGVVKEVLLNGYSMQDDIMKPIVIVR